MMTEYPQLKMGDIVYVLKFDNIKKYEVERHPHGDDLENGPFYSLKDDGGLHSNISQKDLGISAFTQLIDAEKTATENSKSLFTVEVSSLPLVETHYYSKEFTRGKPSLGFISKIGESMVLHRYCGCYTFLSEFLSGKERDKYYRTQLTDGFKDATEVEPFKIEEKLYYSYLPYENPNGGPKETHLFATLEYAFNHTTSYGRNKNILPNVSEKTIDQIKNKLTAAQNTNVQLSLF